MVKGTFYMRGFGSEPLVLRAECIVVKHAGVENRLSHVEITKPEGVKTAYINGADVSAYWIEEY